MARQRPPSLRIDVGDNSAVPARLRNILEAHPETASSSPGSLRSAFAFVTDLRHRCRRVKSDTDTALREMLQLPQLRYAVGDDVVPTDELRAHEREALVALHGLCTSFIEHTDLGTAGARCKELIREAQQLRQPLAGLVGGGASPDVNLCTRFVLALSPCARLLPANAALLAETEGSRSRSRSGSGDADAGGAAVAGAGCSCCATATGSASDPLPAAGRSVSSAVAGGGGGDEDGESVLQGFYAAWSHAAPEWSSRTRRRSYYHSLTSPSSTPRLSGSLPQSNSVPDSLEGAGMAVPPPFTLAVPVERGSSVRSSESLPSPTAGFAAGFAAGGPPPSVDVSGNSSKEAASPRQSRSSSKEAATPKRVRLCGSYVPSGRSSASASVSSGSPDDSFKQAAAAAASAAAASAAACAAGHAKVGGELGELDATHRVPRAPSRAVPRQG